MTSNNDGSTSDPVFDFACFLAASARGALEEGTMAASLRLVDALGRLPTICKDLKDRDEFLSEMCLRVSSDTSGSFLGSRQKFIEMLDDIMKRFAEESVRRNGLEKR